MAGVDRLPQNLFVAGEEVVEVRELMNSRHIEDHRLAIDALRQLCFLQEELTYPPEGKNFRDTHHWYNKRAGRGAPFSRWRQAPENKDLLRRDLHEGIEAVYGWLARPLISEVMEALESEAA